jgi:hypothetical protein
MRSCADECVYMYMCMNGYQRVGGRLSSVNVPNSPCAYDTSKHATVEDERKIAEHTTVARRENPTRRTQSRAFKIPRRLVKVSMEWVFLLSMQLPLVDQGLDTTNLTTRQCNGKIPRGQSFPHLWCCTLPLSARAPHSWELSLEVRYPWRLWIPDYQNSVGVLSVENV